MVVEGERMITGSYTVLLLVHYALCIFKNRATDIMKELSQSTVVLCI